MYILEIKVNLGYNSSGVNIIIILLYLSFIYLLIHSPFLSCLCRCMHMTLCVWRSQDNSVTSFAMWVLLIELRFLSLTISALICSVILSAPTILRQCLNGTGACLFSSASQAGIGQCLPPQCHDYEQKSHYTQIFVFKHWLWGLNLCPYTYLILLRPQPHGTGFQSSVWLEESVFQRQQLEQVFIERQCQKPVMIWVNMHEMAWLIA